MKRYAAGSPFGALVIGLLLVFCAPPNALWGQGELTDVRIPYQLAVVGSASSSSHVYVIPGHTSSTSRRTQDFGYNRKPRWSPDGSKILYERKEPKGYDLYVMNADGSNGSRLTNASGDDISAEWSPDGTRIAFASFRDGSGEVYLMNADGSGQTNLTVHSSHDVEPSWSPDGSKIAFTSSRDGNRDIYLVNADGSNLTQLTTEPTSDWNPMWSPDGSKIAFKTRRNGPESMYVMDSNGDNPSLLLEFATIDLQWSPDGTRVAFTTSLFGTSPDVYIQSLAGGELVNVTNTPNDQENFPTWSPDGMHLAYLNIRMGPSSSFADGIYVQGSEAGEPRHLVFEDRVYGEAPQWGPPSPASPPPHVGFSELLCTASSVPLMVRTEDMTARMGDILLSCVNSDPSSIPSVSYFQGDLRIDQGNLSNNINFGAGANRIDAVLIVNDNNCENPSSEGGRFECGGDYQDPQYGDATDRLNWPGIQVPYPGAFEPRLGRYNPSVTSLRISGLRGSVHSYDDSPEPVDVYATFVELTTPSKRVFGGQVKVAVASPGLVFGGVSPEIDGQACSASALGTEAKVRISEGFATGFRPEGVPTFEQTDAQESGYFAPGSNNGGGASGPTQIRLGLTGVPGGVDLFVPTTVSNGAGLVMTLAGNSCTSSGQLNQIVFDASGDAELIYDVCSAVATKVEQLDIPISAQWAAGAPDLGLAEIEVSFWPIVGSSRPSLPEPEPRFRRLASDTPVPLLSMGPCGLSEQIVVAADGLDSYEDIYVVRGGLGGIDQLTGFGNGDENPHWSPDGSKILFQRSFKVYVVNSDGSEESLLTQGFGNFRGPQWSPSGTQIAVADYQKTPTELTVIDSTNGQQLASFTSTYFVNEQVWSPDGSRIAFTDTIVGDWRIFTADLDGTSVVNVSGTSGTYNDVGLSWSPDGSKIVFGRDDKNTYADIFVMNADGSGQTNLTNTSSVGEARPQWSPDGSKIAYCRSGDVYYMDADGSNVVNLTDHHAVDCSPQWSPDGKQIAFLSDRRGPRSVFVQNIAGGEAFAVFPERLGRVAAFEWKPRPRSGPPPPPPVDPPPVDPPPPPPEEEEEIYLTKMAVYSDGKWLKDDNGDGVLEDETETSFGYRGAIPLVGDWNGDGKQEIAVYANIFGTGFWYLDLNGNGTWDDGVDQVSLLGWGNTNAKPVVGDWNGDGRSKIGIYSNGLWLLDYDGNGTLNGADKIFELGGWQGSVPLVGDWNGDGRDSGGIYVPGYFVLDYNGDHHFENDAEDRVYEFGIRSSNVVPVIGDWTGDGKTKVGIFRAGQWSLDLDGDGQDNGSGESLFFYGPREAVPVVGDWTNIGKDTLGAIDDGAWYLDINGDFVHDGFDPILFWGDEGVNRVFVPGKWQSPGE